jgi:hypothetical protein
MDSRFPRISGVRQGCIIFPSLFLLGIVSMMKRVTEELHKIHWIFTASFQYIDFTDVISLIFLLLIMSIVLGTIASEGLKFILHQ